ncbi:MAG: hypothetical protein CMM58_12695 [Rhodospirillaceae bacterium]|nr:hypothetical protein [Rhodospirillaceae bacterium]
MESYYSFFVSVYQRQALVGKPFFGDGNIILSAPLRFYFLNVILSEIQPWRDNQFRNHGDRVFVFGALKTGRDRDSVVATFFC